MSEHEHLEHEHLEDGNDAVWRSDAGVAHWIASSEGREAKRAEQRLLLAELLPFEHDEAFTFLDLGAGTGSASRAVLERYPRARAILADFSAQMREEGSRALAVHDGRFSYVELDLNGGPWPEEIPAAVPAVITSLSVHHLPDERKAALFSEIFHRLEPGGWYLNYDAVKSDDEIVASAWQRAGDRLDPEEKERREHPTPEQAARHANHVRHLIPLDEQLAMLRAAGFEAVDVYWKQLDFVITGGRRPLRGADTGDSTLS